jgi:ADP-ribosylglycohydrolase
MPLPKDYEERVYAGVLGKIIGVYLGRPFEGWRYAQIMARLGEINYYVHEKLDKRLVVTDDDIAGTFTFVRALEDYHYDDRITAAQIGQTWLNYLIERRTILWWGGLGNSTEHTAFLRLKSGVAAPESGSIGLNGNIIAEQIGAQIFIDGWAMVSPGDPEKAADLARKAASVSHDGEAIYGAQVVAAIEAQAFVEPEMDRLLDTAVSLIPKDSIIQRMIADVREWHTREKDWHAARDLIQGRYGYDKYGGNCHMVPNHALIILSLLYGEDDFQKSLMIVNTSGWDTDCNSGNVGCIMGIKNGLSGIEAGPDWRGPVADRIYIVSADGGRAVTDAVRETYGLVNTARALAKADPVAPKGGARFHFSLPGSVQGFRPEDSTECRGTVTVGNEADGDGRRKLALHYRYLAPDRIARVGTPTFIPPEDLDMTGYNLMASPTLHPGQTVRADLAASGKNRSAVKACLFVKTYDATDQPALLRSPVKEVKPGGSIRWAWKVPDTEGAPVIEVGPELRAAGGEHGTVHLDSLSWEGEADTVLLRPPGSGTLWKKAWINGIDNFMTYKEPYRILQNNGTGLLIQGSREWKDYRFRAEIIPTLVKSAGIAVRVQGMRRYYALILSQDGKARLVKALDGDQILAETELPWTLYHNYRCALQIEGRLLRAFVDDEEILKAEDSQHPLEGGGVALLCEEGCYAIAAVAVAPLG